MRRRKTVDELDRAEELRRASRAMGKDMSAIRVQSIRGKSYTFASFSGKKCQAGQKAFVVRFRDKIFHILYAHLLVLCND